VRCFGGRSTSICNIHRKLTMMYMQLKRPSLKMIGIMHQLTLKFLSISSSSSRVLTKLAEVRITWRGRVRLPVLAYQLISKPVHAKNILSPAYILYMTFIVLVKMKYYCELRRKGYSRYCKQTHEPVNETTETARRDKFLKTFLGRSCQT
jgi:hypothetical protein